jgi:cytochrome c peroxidase
MRKGIYGIVLLGVAFSIGQLWAVETTDIESLGGFLFTDKQLSLNKNQSCQTCHNQS